MYHRPDNVDSGVSGLKKRSEAENQIGSGRIRRKMDNVRTEAQQAQKAWESQQTLSLGKLEGTIQEFVKAAPFLREGGKGLKSVATQAKAAAKVLA